MTVLGRQSPRVRQTGVVLWSFRLELQEGETGDVSPSVFMARPSGETPP